MRAVSLHSNFLCCTSLYAAWSCGGYSYLGALAKGELELEMLLVCNSGIYLCVLQSISITVQFFLVVPSTARASRKSPTPPRTE